MRYVYKIIACILLLVIANTAYQWHQFDEDVARYADQYHQIMKVQHADVLYLSASSNFAPEDTPEEDPRKISQFLSDHLSNDLRVEAINKPASHAGAYRHYLACLPNTAEVETLVVTMNLRSFGPDWVHSELETALNQANLFYNQRPPLLNRLLLSLKAYDNKSTEERQALRNAAWEHDPLPFDPPKHRVNAWCAVEKWGDWRNPKRQLADQFIKQYGFVVDDTHPRVADFDAIVAESKARNLFLVLHILPENMERAEELVGPELPQLMRMNADWLLERYRAMGVTVVDNLELLGDRHFRDRDFPTEHYDQAGREQIAAAIAKKGFKK
jgi:hypothetical protein